MSHRLMRACHLTYAWHSCMKSRTLILNLLSKLEWYENVPVLGLVYECMVSITNINNGIKEPTCQYLNCNSDHILIFGGYVKVRESLYA